MKCNAESYTTIAPHILRSACEQWLVYREQKITEKQEELIRQAIPRRFKRDRTREEAIVYLKDGSGGFISQWYWTTVWCKNENDVVNSLIRLADMATGGVMISRSDASIIWKFVEIK